MEKCFYSSWSEELSWTQCQTGLNSLVPLIPPPSESNSFQLQGYADGFPISSWLEPFEGSEEDGAASASNHHNQAEKRRRDRINAHLATLRKLIPKSDKMDKAALLGSVVEQVKDLKREALELSKVFTFPADTDQVIVDSSPGFESDSNQSQDNFFIEASICCEDRPELVSELNDALKGLKLTIVQAHMIGLGGRIQGTFILCNEDSTTKLDGIGTDTLKQSLRLVLGRIASSSTTSNYRIRSKRQRFFFPSH